MQEALARTQLPVHLVTILFLVVMVSTSGQNNLNILAQVVFTSYTPFININSLQMKDNKSISTFLG